MLLIIQRLKLMIIGLEYNGIQFQEEIIKVMLKVFNIFNVILIQVEV